MIENCEGFIYLKPSFFAQNDFGITPIIIIRNFSFTSFNNSIKRKYYKKIIEK